jgi:hypothetical protein
MKISSLEKMETIVSKNRALSWEGWNVVELIKLPTAWSKRNGAFVNGSWFIKTTFPVSEDGWSIPNKYVR